MKKCFSEQVNEALASDVYGLFGSGQILVVVNADRCDVTTINNSIHIQELGPCNPIAGLGGQQVGAIVVGGTGGGALHKLKISGLQVFQAQHGTIDKNMVLFNADELPECMLRHNCGAQGRDHECSH